MTIYQKYIYQKLGEGFDRRTFVKWIFGEEEHIQKIEIDEDIIEKEEIREHFTSLLPNAEVVFVKQKNKGNTTLKDIEENINKRSKDQKDKDD